MENSELLTPQGNLNIDDTLEELAINKLKEIVATQDTWVKVHAAEFLLWSGKKHDQLLLNTFLEENGVAAHLSPYRIGIWRVLAQAEADPLQKQRWTGKIIDAFLDLHGKDRVHAAESLAKLKISPLDKYPEITEMAIDGEDKILSICTRWSTAFSSAEYLNEVQAACYNIAVSPQNDAGIRKLAAYVCCQTGHLPVNKWLEFSTVALSEAAGAEVRPSLLKAAVITVPHQYQHDIVYQQAFDALLEYRDRHEKAVRVEIASALAEKGNMQHLPFLISFFNNPPLENVESDNADIQAYTAYAILMIIKRNKYNRR